MRRRANQMMVCAVAAAAVMMTACGGGNKETQAAASAETEESSALSIETESKSTLDETETETEETMETETESESEDKAEEVSAKASGLDAAYEKIVNEYRQMIREKWDPEKVFNTELSSMIPDFYEMGAEKEVGYTLLDLDNDGKKELLIGETDTKEAVNRIIFDAYTLKNGKAEQIFVSASRDLYYLIEDEAGPIEIVNEASNGAANSAWICYIVNGTQLKPVQSVTYDASEDEENPWFTSTDADWDTSNDTSISESEAQRLIDSYATHYAKLDWTPIMQ